MEATPVQIPQVQQFPHSHWHWMIETVTMMELSISMTLTLLATKMATAFPHQMISSQPTQLVQNHAMPDSMADIRVRKLMQGIMLQLGPLFNYDVMQVHTSQAQARKVA